MSIIDNKIKKIGKNRFLNISRQTTVLYIFCRENLKIKEPYNTQPGVYISFEENAAERAELMELLKPKMLKLF